jgi:hypothetical protein
MALPTPRLVTIFYTTAQGQVVSIQLDASLEETHRDETEITDSPVEQGIDISDHIRAKPTHLTIKGMVTNWPTNAGNGTRSQSVQLPSGGTFQNSTLAAWVAGRAEQAYEQLLQLKAGVLVSVTTTLRTYGNMALQSLEVPRSAKIGDSVQFTASFKEVQIVQNQTVQIARAPDKQANKNIGKTGTQPGLKSNAADLADAGADSKNPVLSTIGKAFGGKTAP